MIERHDVRVLSTCTILAIGLLFSVLIFGDLKITAASSLIWAGVIVVACTSATWYFIAKALMDRVVSNSEELDLSRAAVAQARNDQRRAESLIVQMASARCIDDLKTLDTKSATLCSRVGDSALYPNVAVLATLNNHAGWLTDEEFAHVCGILTALATKHAATTSRMHSVACIRRNAAPEVLTGINAAVYQELTSL